MVDVLQEDGGFQVFLTTLAFFLFPLTLNSEQIVRWPGVLERDNLFQAGGKTPLPGQHVSLFFVVAVALGI